MQLVTPRVVPTAVRLLMMSWMMYLTVSFFIAVDVLIVKMENGKWKVENGKC